jgi:hypothetical protein
MLPKTGSEVPFPRARPSERVYLAEIFQALHAELDGTGGVTKTIMRWTGASDRTARNWMSGAAGPSGYHLICLARESDAILAAMLTLSGRPELALATDVHAVEVALAKAMGSIEVLKRQHASKSRRHREVPAPS